MFEAPDVSPDGRNKKSLMVMCPAFRDHTGKRNKQGTLGQLFNRNLISRISKQPFLSKGLRLND